MHLESNFLQEIKGILATARKKSLTYVNRAMIDAYWDIGRRIVEEEQKGEDRAQYGTFLLRELANALSQDLDKALDERELRKMRQFYQYFPIRDTLCPELTWSHFRTLLRHENPLARNYYMREAASGSWSVRSLARNIQSFYYERIISSQTSTLENSPEPKPADQIAPADLIKDPFVLEFLRMDMPAAYTENDLETAILGKIQQFLLEMGKGFAFVARQYPIKTDTRIFYIDLVFYNFILKNFVLVDLKTKALSHQDIGQMDMYVRMFEALKKIPGDNPTIGIILSSDKDETLVKYSVLEESKQLFASSYRLVLPSEEDLSKEIEKARKL